ncbi:MAG: glucose-6-phosphate isomerase, partial [Acidimicrobiia bacterium]
VRGSPASVTVGIGAEPPGDTDIRITVEHPHGVAALMFVLEFATAVAGEILGINPFDQPDVQMAKQLASRAMEGDLDSSGVVPIDVSESRWAETLKQALADRAASYISIQAYIPQTPDNTSLLDALRLALSEISGAYVTIGFGPRFLHSTGQLHKGGPPGGVYLQIIDDTGSALEVPGAGYTFNELIAAQARGDRAALADSGRSVIAVDLGPARDQGLNEMLLRIQQIAIG